MSDLPYDVDQISNYIQAAASQRGIDPDIALRVAKSEGLNSYIGDNNSSFGPYQLHYGGVAPGGNAVGGLGDNFTQATGLDARDPSTIYHQIDFALDHASKNGWGPWHGWTGDPMAGIGGNPSGTPAIHPTQTAGAAPIAPVASAAPTAVAGAPATPPLGLLAPTDTTAAPNTTPNAGKVDMQGLLAKLLAPQQEQQAQHPSQGLLASADAGGGARPLVFKQLTIKTRKFS